MGSVPNNRVQDIIEKDWAYLVREKRLLDSPNYLKENGRPVVAIDGEICAMALPRCCTTDLA